MTLTLSVDVGAPEAAQLVVQKVAGGAPEPTLQLGLNIRFSICSLLEVLGKLQKQEEDSDKAAKQQSQAAASSSKSKISTAKPASEPSKLPAGAAKANRAGSPYISGGAVASAVPTTQSPAKASPDAWQKFKAPDTVAPKAAAPEVPPAAKPAPPPPIKAPNKIEPQIRTGKEELAATASAVAEAARQMLGTASHSTPVQPAAAAAPEEQRDAAKELFSAVFVGDPEVPSDAAANSARAGAAELPVAEGRGAAAKRKEGPDSVSGREDKNLREALSPAATEVPVPLIFKQNGAASEEDVCEDLVIESYPPSPRVQAQPGFPGIDGVDRIRDLASALAVAQSEEHGALGASDIKHQSELLNSVVELAHVCSMTSEASNEFVSTGLEALMAVLKSQRRNISPDIKAQACILLRSICGGDDPGAVVRQRQCVQAGAVEAVVAALDSVPDMELRYQACKTLRRLCSGHSEASNAPKERSAKAGALPSIMAAMKGHEENSDLQVQACRAVSEICCKCKLAQESALNAGALPVLIRALEKHTMNEEVQCSGLAAVTWLCHGGDSAAVARKEQAVCAGALQPAIGALKTPGTGGTLQHEALQMVAELLRGAAGRIKDRFARAGVLEAVVSVLGAFPQSKAIQRRGCEVLAKLCCEEDHSAVERRDRALSVGAVEAAVFALGAFAQDAAVQRAGCQALSCLCDAGEDEGRGQALREHAASVSAVEAVIAALRAHPTDAGLQLDGCSALVVCIGLVKTSLSPQEVVHAEAMDVVTTALQLHREDARIQWKGRHVLFNLLGGTLDSLPGLAYEGQSDPAAQALWEELSL